jgi:hypothetical protein
MFLRGISIVTFTCQQMQARFKMRTYTCEALWYPLPHLPRNNFFPRVPTRQSPSSVSFGPAVTARPAIRATGYQAYE